MKNDNREIGEIIDSANVYIAVTNERVAAKGRKTELMALISSLLGNFLENKVIDEEDLNFIIKLAKEDIKKDNKESVENTLDKTIEDIVKKFFDFENKD
jgi:hypothetical protein